MTTVMAPAQGSARDYLLQDSPFATVADQLTSASGVNPGVSSDASSYSDSRRATQGANSGPSPENFQLSLLKTALDSFFDSLLMINVDGHILHANGQAHRLFANALPQTLTPAAPGAYRSPLSPDLEHQHPLQPLMDEIWRVVMAMMDGQAEFPDQDLVLDSEIAWESEAFRLRVRWMDLAIQHQPCLLVTIEDLQQTAVNQVNVDRWKYKLTPREVEVWGLKRQGYSYKAIATTLFVSENTVKKHLKNIQVKRRAKDGVEI